MSPWTVYWITRLDSLIVIEGVLLAIGVVVLFASILTFSFNRIEAANRNTYNKEQCLAYASQAKQYLKWLVPTCAVLTLACAFTPDTRQMAAIYIIPAITSKEAQKEAGDIYDLAKKYLKKQAKDAP